MNCLKMFSLMLAVAFVCSVSVAQDSGCSKCPSEGSCSKCPASTSAVAAATDDKECAQCPVTAAMKNLPAMTYMVGDESVCCSASAAALAKKNDKPLQYVVGKKTFENEQEAYTALVESTESFVEKFIAPCKCETTGTTTIAGKSCGCPVEAGKNAELVKKAVSEVKMTYVVGDAKCNCPNEAKSLAAKSDDKTKYVVEGKETCCNLEARLNLAKAKYAAAVKALAATNKESDKKEGSAS